MDIVVNMLSFMVLFMVLVGVHEWGHYYAAKRSGVLIKQFSIGFGPVIFSRKDKDGVLWRFSLIPLGGFVEMLEESSRKDGEKGKSFNQTTYMQKVAILLGGPVMNLVLGFFLFLALNSFTSSALGSFVTVKEGSPAFQAGMSGTARINSINGKDVVTFNQLFGNLVTVNGDQFIDVTFTPKGEKNQKTARIDISDITFSARNPDHLDKIGFKMPEIKPTNIIGKIQEGSVAQKANLKIGDSIIRIGDHKIKEWDDLSSAIKNIHADGSLEHGVKILVSSGSSQREVVLNIDSKDQKIGIYPFHDAESYIVDFESTIPDVFARAYKQTVDSATMIFRTVSKLVSGDISLKSMSSPIGIAKATGDSVRIGLVQSLFISAIISVNLFVFNLLPIPALDGGRVLICSIEAATGRPLPKYIMSAAVIVSLTLILSLTMYGVYNDLKDIF